MKAYIADIIPKIKKYSKRLDELTLLTNQHWVVIDEEDSSKNVYIFRTNNELLISKNGKVEKARWEYLGQNTLLIDKKEESFLFKQGFFDENILALGIDGNDKYVFFVNESKHYTELNTIENVVKFLQERYIYTDALRNTSKRIDTKKPNYNTPDYTEKIKEGNQFLISDKYTVILIQFNDGVNGKIYVSKKTNISYFKEKPSSAWASYKYYYTDKVSCIRALHYFKIYDKPLNENFMYSI